MNERKSIEIICRSCGKESLLLRKPMYEGLKKTGEILACAGCGHIYESEEQIPYKYSNTVDVFDKGDLPGKIEIFEEGENRKICRYCNNYIVNPFTQWCSVHKEEVAATDTCDRFETRPEPMGDDIPAGP